GINRAQEPVIDDIVVEHAPTSVWSDDSLKNLSQEDVQLIANTLFFFYKQALFQSLLQEQLIVLGEKSTQIYEVKGENPLHSRAKELNETATYIEKITYHYDYIVRVMNQVMVFWRSNTSEWQKAYKMLEDIGAVDLFSHVNM